MHRWGGSQAFPSVITVFSAPNYCGSYKNKGAVILIENDKMNIKQYKEVEQPFHLPGQLDLFSWSLPFLIDKIGEMMDNLLRMNSLVKQDEINKSRRSSVKDFNKIIHELEDEQKKQEEQKFNRIKAKVLTMGRMSAMLKNVRENKESIEQAKNMTKDHKLPAGTLQNMSGTKGHGDMKHNLDDFIKSHVKDEDDKFPLAVFRRNSEKERPKK